MHRTARRIAQHTKLAQSSRKSKIKQCSARRRAFGSWRAACSPALSSTNMLPRELLHRILIRPSLPTTRSLCTSPRRQNVIAELESRGMVADLTSFVLPSLPLFRY